MISPKNRPDFLVVVNENEPFASALKSQIPRNWVVLPDVMRHLALRAIAGEAIAMASVVNKVQAIVKNLLVIIFSLLFYPLHISLSGSLRLILQQYQHSWSRSRII